jgi:hypothetical protein
MALQRKRTLSDLENPSQQPAIHATSATARLPGLDIEIFHRRSPDGDAERISINLRAVPSFEAIGRYVECANPFAFCTQSMQLAAPVAQEPQRSFGLRMGSRSPAE